MVLLFLKQLAMPGRADEDTDETDSTAGSEACDDGEDKTTNKNKAPKLKRTDYKIEIPLADRRKRGRDGCAYIRFIFSSCMAQGSHICLLYWRNDSSMKVLSFPRKCKTGSAQSLGQEVFHYLPLLGYIVT